MPGVDDLARQALAIVNQVTDDPEGRYLLRERFYDKYGFPDLAGLDRAGYGNSELAFLRWEIERGVLQPLPTGSQWWRSVNAMLCFDAELAALIHESGLDIAAPPGAQRWLDYINKPNERTWYQAHNGSIAGGYLAQTVAARAEQDGEQCFMNIVLYRVLYAEAMVAGATFLGLLGRLIANPKLPAVDLITDVRDFYPRHYPLTRDDVRNLKGKGDSIFDLAVRIFDELLILPEAMHLYHHAADSLKLPALAEMVQDGRPVYPK